MKTYIYIFCHVFFFMIQFSTILSHVHNSLEFSLSILPFNLFFNSLFSSFFFFGISFPYSYLLSFSLPLFRSLLPIVCDTPFTPSSNEATTVNGEFRKTKGGFLVFDAKSHLTKFIPIFFSSAIFYDNRECEGHHIASTLRMTIYSQKHDDITYQIKSYNTGVLISP